MARVHGTSGDLTLSGDHELPGPVKNAGTGEIKSFTVDFVGDIEVDMEFGVGDGAETIMRGMHSARGSFEAWFESELTPDFPVLTPFVTTAPGASNTDGTMVLTLDAGNTVSFPAMFSNVSYEHTRTGFCVVRGNFESSGTLS